MAQLPLPLPIGKLEGLPTNTVYNIIQDKKLFLWLGTEKGLVRYDGKHFNVFTNTQMQSVAVSDLRFDKNGVLRCQNFSGQHFYWQNDSLFLDTLMPIIGNYSPVFEDKLGKTFDAGYNFVKTKNGKKETISFTAEIFGLLSFNGEVFTFDKENVYSIENKKVVKKIPFNFAGETVFFPVEANGKLYVFPRKKQVGVVYEFFPDCSAKHLQLPPSTIQTVEFINKLFFIGTNIGLFVFDENFHPIFGNQILLQNKSVSHVFKDAEGAIWVSTLDAGLFKFTCFDCLFYGADEPLSAVYASDFDGEVYVGNIAGTVMNWNSKNGLTTFLKTDDRQRITSIYYRKKNTEGFLAGDNFYVLSQNKIAAKLPFAVKKITAPNDSFLVLSRTGGVVFAKRKAMASAIKNNQILIQTRGWLFYQPFVINNNSIRVKHCAYDKITQTAYAATSIGLLKISDSGWSEIKYHSNSIAATDVELHNDSLFVATSSGGLLLLKNGSVVKDWNASNSALPNTIKQIEWQNNLLWIAASHQLFSLNLANNKLEVFELTNGYDINDFTFKKDTVLIATDIGLLVFNQHFLFSEKTPLLLHLTHFSAGKKKLNLHEEISLPHHDNNLKLEFTVPYFNSQENVSVTYKINDEAWQLLEEGQRQLNFISMQPERYCVQLRAISNDGRISPIQTVFFEVKPPFWKTWWFYVLSLTLVAASGYIVYRYRLKFIQKQNELEHQKIELENKLRESILASVKAQMNPHFIFNALNTIQSYIYLNDKQNATAFLGKFSQLTRTILEMSNKNEVSLDEEIDSILLYLELEKMRFDDTLNYTIEVDKNIVPSSIRIPSMIIQPYIENAVKHGLLHKKGERWIRCSFGIQNKMLEVRIDDNGVGRARSKELNKIKNKKHQSFATQANEKRLEVLNQGAAGSVNVTFIDKMSEQGEALGTTVILFISLAD